MIVAAFTQVVVLSLVGPCKLSCTPGTHSSQFKAGKVSSDLNIERAVIKSAASTKFPERVLGRDPVSCWHSLPDGPKIGRTKVYKNQVKTLTRHGQRSEIGGSGPQKMCTLLRSEPPNISHAPKSTKLSPNPPKIVNIKQNKH